MQTLPKSQQGTVSGTLPILEQQQAKGLLRAFLALRHRNFRLFWFGQLISLMGTWMQSIGQSWLVLELTHSAWLLGLVGALQFLPVMLLSLFGGVLADRLPKRKVLLFTQSSALIQAVILWILVATGSVQLWHVLALAALLGLTNALDMPTRQAFVVEMVGRDDLPNAIALNSSLFNMARIVGPGIGGLIIAWQGVAPLFLLNAISFIPVIIGLAMIDLSKLHAHSKRIEVPTGTPKQSTFQSLREGLAYVWHTPSILLIIAVIGAVSLFGINFNVVLPLFATAVLNVGPAGFGFISSAFGLGSLLSALWLAWSNHKPTIHYVLISAFVFCIAEAAFAISQSYPLSLLLIAGTGFAQIAFSATSNTTLQTVAPDYLRGRVMSVYMLVFAGSVPLGNLLTGGLAHWFGAPIALLIEAGVSFVATAIGWFMRKPAEKNLAESIRLDEHD
ncbi:MAG TPA: MFS transporter [Ktedonobacteraceae bacterium]|nr:MFS transporter [Ktedonobacteraceae bacterium]